MGLSGDFLEAGVPIPSSPDSTSLVAFGVVASCVIPPLLLFGHNTLFNATPIPYSLVYVSFSMVAFVVVCSLFLFGDAALFDASSVPSSSLGAEGSSSSSLLSALSTPTKINPSNIPVPLTPRRGGVRLPALFLFGVFLFVVSSLASFFRLLLHFGVVFLLDPLPFVGGVDCAAVLPFGGVTGRSASGFVSSGSIFGVRGCANHQKKCREMATKDL